MSYGFIKYLIFGIFICVGVYLRFIALDSVRTGPEEWIARDFSRAFDIIDGSFFPLAGPESGYGSRLPGPFLYFLTSIPLLFHYSLQS